MWFKDIVTRVLQAAAGGVSSPAMPSFIPLRAKALMCCKRLQGKFQAALFLESIARLAFFGQLLRMHWIKSESPNLCISLPNFDML